jgi:hypothetical protein
MALLLAIADVAGDLDQVFYVRIVIGRPLTYRQRHEDTTVFCKAPQEDLIVEAFRVFDRHYEQFRRSRLGRQSPSISMRPRFFIGLGRSPVWRELKDYLRDHMGNDVFSFEQDSRAGISTKEVLAEYGQHDVNHGVTLRAMTEWDVAILSLKGVEHGREVLTQYYEWAQARWTNVAKGFGGLSVTMLAGVFGGSTEVKPANSVAPSVWALVISVLAASAFALAALFATRRAASAHSEYITAVELLTVWS